MPPQSDLKQSERDGTAFVRELRRLLVVPVSALLLLSVFLTIGILKLVRSAKLVDHTDQVIAAAGELQSLISDEQAGFEHFLLTRDPAMLGLVKNTRLQVGRALDSLDQLVRDNAAQQLRLQSIRASLASENFPGDPPSSSLPAPVPAPVPAHVPAPVPAHVPAPVPAPVKDGMGRRGVSARRDQVRQFVQVEYGLRESRTRQNRRDLFLLLLTLGPLSAVGGAVVAVWFFRKIADLKRRDQAQADAVYQERQWLNTTMRAIGDAVIATDSEGRITFMNPSAASASGWTEQEAIGKPLDDVFHIVHEETRAEVESPVAKVQRTGMVCGLANHTVLIRKDGTEISIDDSGAPIRDSQGTIIGIILIFRNIEERRIAERTREESERTLNDFVDAIPTLAWMSDASGWILWYNRRWYEYTGTTEEEMKGWGWQSVHDPAVLPSVLERWTGSIKSGISFEMVFPLRGADGVFRSFLTRVVPIRDSAGAVTRWFGTNTEIDELERTRVELREKSELIDLAQTAVSAGYWSYFPATGDCYLSPGEQELFGCRHSARPMLGEVLSHIHEADRDHVIQALKEGMESGVYFAEFRVSKDDGSLRWLAGQGRVLIRADGEKYMVGINFDVTNRKLSEDALRKSEKLAVAGRLAATMAHEINNPLESVTNLLYVLRISISDAEALQYLTTAEEELARVTQIVTQSLRFHRQSTFPTYERVSEILDSAAAIYKSRLLVSQIEIKRKYRDSDKVYCYSSELRQVFGNFIGNAFDAVRKGGVICLRTREVFDPSSGKRGIRITIADSGHGMDSYTLQRISEPFFTTKGIHGTGLGLWISSDILKKHRGTVQVKSREGEGRTGTVFSIFLPTDAIEETTSSISATTLESANSSRST